MESLVSFSKWLSKWFTVAVILWAAFNYALPATSSWVIPNTAYLLGLILFGMGLTLTTEDFKRIAKRPIPVVLGTVAHYVIMPGLAWLLCMIFPSERFDSSRGYPCWLLSKWDFIECYGLPFRWGCCLGCLY